MVAGETKQFSLTLDRTSSVVFVVTVPPDVEVVVDGLSRGRTVAGPLPPAYAGCARGARRRARTRLTAAGAQRSHAGHAHGAVQEGVLRHRGAEAPDREARRLPAGSRSPAARRRLDCVREHARRRGGVRRWRTARHHARHSVGRVRRAADRGAARSRRAAGAAHRGEDGREHAGARRLEAGLRPADGRIRAAGRRLRSPRRRGARPRRVATGDGVRARAAGRRTRRSRDSRCRPSGWRSMRDDGRLAVPQRSTPRHGGTSRPGLHGRSTCRASRRSRSRRRARPTLWLR